MPMVDPFRLSRLAVGPDTDLPGGAAERMNDPPELVHGGNGGLRRVRHMKVYRIYRSSGRLGRVEEAR